MKITLDLNDQQLEQLKTYALVMDTGLLAQITAAEEECKTYRVHAEIRNEIEKVLHKASTHRLPN